MTVRIYREKHDDRGVTITLILLCVVLCVLITAGVMWALFTGSQKVTNHLQVGNLEIALKRTELVKTTLDEKGFLATADPDRNSKDFSEPTNDNVFGIVDGEKIVPGTKYVATMQLENLGDVGFGYWVKIECESKDVAKALAKQLKLVVYTDKNGDGVIDMASEGTESTVASGLEIGSVGDFIEKVAIGTSGTFIVSVEFVDAGYTYEDGVLASTNDVAKTQSLNFDLVVYAVSAVG